MEVGFRDKETGYARSVDECMRQGIDGLRRSVSGCDLLEMRFLDLR